MRFAIQVDAKPDALTDARMLEAIASYHEELARAGVLLDANGRTGHAIIEAKSREEALEWTRRSPLPARLTTET